MNNLTKKELIDKVIELEKENKEQKKKFQAIYNANKDKKEQNADLRAEIKLLKKKNMELSILLDTILKQRRKSNDRRKITRD